MLFGIFVLVASIFGFGAGTLPLAGKRFIAVLSAVLLSAPSTFILVAFWLYGYGYGKCIMFFSISHIYTFAGKHVSLGQSKAAFFEYATIAETANKQAERLDKPS